MTAYFRFVTDRTILRRSVGHGLVLPPGFAELSVELIAKCSFAQHLIQRIIYTTHGAELLDAKKALRQFPNPKARLDFLCSFKYSSEDPTISKVFDYARSLFGKLYEVRNILCHEIWSTSDAFKDEILFSSLDIDAQHLLDCGNMWHKEEVTPEEAFRANVAYIRGTKVMSCGDLKRALASANICTWILMHITNILGETDVHKKSEAIRAFRVFRGTAHLFGGPLLGAKPVNFRSRKQRVVRGRPKSVS